jgi:hypothetical protein
LDFEGWEWAAKPEINDRDTERNHRGTEAQRKAKKRQIH